jgi:hypothetical protein
LVLHKVPDPLVTNFLETVLEDLINVRMFLGSVACGVFVFAFSPRLCSYKHAFDVPFGSTTYEPKDGEGRVFAVAYCLERAMKGLPMSFWNWMLSFFSRIAGLHERMRVGKLLYPVWW